MNNRRIFPIILALIMTFAITPAIMHADTWNQETTITFSQPVEIPGQVLAAGTYWFVLADSTSNRNIVQIFSADKSILYATLFTVSNERLQPTDDTVLTFGERSSGEQEAILTWFYPGETIGHEFIYPKMEEEELSRNVHRNVVPEPVEVATYADEH